MYPVHMILFRLLWALSTYNTVVREVTYASSEFGHPYGQPPKMCRYVGQFLITKRVDYTLRMLNQGNALSKLGINSCCYQML